MGALVNASLSLFVGHSSGVYAHYWSEKAE